MIIDGKQLSRPILASLQQKIESLKKKGIIPTIAIVTVGKEDVWSVYVAQKIKNAKRLEVRHQLIDLKHADEAKLLQTIKQLNNNSNIHGIIVQRPLPKEMNREKIVSAIKAEKDIDGFRSDSKFQSPIWLAVESILKHVFIRLHLDKGVTFIQWLGKKRIVVIGKGETGGGPVIFKLKRMGISPDVVDSSTSKKEKNKRTKDADIIISAVGGKRVVEEKNIKKGSILIGIGIHKEKEKLVGDYDEKEIESIASYYTPTPGGVGPLNLAYLFKNLVDSARNLSK